MAASAKENEKAGGAGTRTGRSFPLVWLLAYYVALVLAGGILIALVPGARLALVAPLVAPPVSELGALLTGGHPIAPASAAPWPGPGGRGALTLIAALGALSLALPIAWVLMYTRRLRYDPSLVHAVIVLPIVVAGVVLVVKNSLALAFALAAIVAGVRFRQKLEEPEEAVYVLLALGIGLAAGVQALDVALVMSLSFNLVVLTLWRYDVGAIYAGGRGALLATGDALLLQPSVSDAQREVEARAAAHAEGMEPDGMLVVRGPDPGATRHSIEIVAGRFANEWRISDPIIDDHGLARFEVVLRLKKNVEPAQVIAELGERWSDRITAAEYVPFGSQGDAEPAPE